MTWIDGHLDLAYLAVQGRDLREEIRDPRRACITLPALRRAKVDLVLGTIFTEPDPEGREGSFTYPGPDALEAAEAAGRRQLEIYRRLEDDGQITIVRCRDDLSGGGPRPGVVLLMEGADPIRDPDHVSWWFDRGVRLVGLTWAAGTRYAGGNGRHGPLSPLGIEMVRALDEAGIVHDVSHLADDAFDGLLEHATGPIVATHSNCRALAGDDQRHLRDDQVQAIAQRGGVIGLNLYGPFLAAGRPATTEDCLAHVQHVCALMGHRRGVGLGSDMDGGFGPDDMPTDFRAPSDLPRLTDALRAAGWSKGQVEGFARGNWMEFLERVLTSSKSD